LLLIHEQRRLLDSIFSPAASNLNIWKLLTNQQSIYICNKWA